MQLFHFSHDAAISVFRPRPVNFPSRRPTGSEWLNGPLVWAIDDWHQPMYLFPRDCPRILLWPTADTNQEDRERYLGGGNARMIAYLEASWVERHRSARLYRYELPVEPFESLNDAGMWVSRVEVRPLGAQSLDNLPLALQRHNVDLRVLDSLAPLKELWATSLHVSGIRLRNAQGWHEG